MLIIEKQNKIKKFAARFYIKSHEFHEATSASAVKTSNFSICICSKRADRSFSLIIIMWVKEPKRRKMEEGIFFFNKIKMFVVSRVATLFYYSMTKWLLALYDTAGKCHHVCLRPA